MCPFDSHIVVSLKMTINKPPTNYIRELLELILGKNCFQFENKYFLQKIGCAMGSTASPEILYVISCYLLSRTKPCDMPNLSSHG